MNEISHIILMTIDSLRADFLPYERILSLIPKEIRSNVIYFNGIAAGPYTWASLPSIFTGLYPRVHEFGNFIPSETNLVTLAKHNGFKTIAISSSIAIEKMLEKLYNQFHWVISPERDNHYNGKSWLNIVMRCLKDLRKAIEDMKHWNTYIKEAYYYSVVFKYALQGSPNPFIPAYDILPLIIKYLRKADGKYFQWVHLMDIHDPYTHDVIRSYGICNYILTLVKYMYYKYGLRNSIKYLDIGREFLNVNPDIREHFYDLYSMAVKAFLISLKRFMNKIVDFIKEKNVIVLITSDHGEELMEHGIYGHLGIISPFGYITHLHLELLLVPIIFIVSDDIIDRFVNILNLTTLNKSNTSLLSHYDVYNILRYMITREELKLNTRGLKRNNYVSESQTIVQSVLAKKGLGVNYSIISTSSDRLLQYIFNPLIGEEFLEYRRYGDVIKYIRRIHDDKLISEFRNMLFNVIKIEAKEVVRVKLREKIRKLRSR